MDMDEQTRTTLLHGLRSQSPLGRGRGLLMWTILRALDVENADKRVL